MPDATIYVQNLESLGAESSAKEPLYNPIKNQYLDVVTRPVK